MQAENNQNQAEAQIKILVAYNAAPENSDSDTIPNVPLKKNYSTGILQAHKYQGKKTPSIKLLSITVCCARRLEFLSTSINRIPQKFALGSGPTSNSSREAW